MVVGVGAGRGHGWEDVRHGEATAAERATFAAVVEAGVPRTATAQLVLAARCGHDDVLWVAVCADRTLDLRVVGCGCVAGCGRVGAAGCERVGEGGYGVLVRAGTGVLVRAGVLVMLVVPSVSILPVSASIIDTSSSTCSRTLSS